MGVCVALMFGYEEWWQWLLCIFASCLILYTIIGIAVLVFTVYSVLHIYKYWKCNKKEIKFKLYVLFEQLFNPFTPKSVIEQYVHNKYNL